MPFLDFMEMTVMDASMHSRKGLPGQNIIICESI